ncbi:MAG: PAS domain-containing sensor histidine kinase [Sedimentisphaerales bacterium]|nr:PAS domain-containing sensor histidine kinase [Sedimentisphaerales bacterium]
MASAQYPTQFAPADRADGETIRRQKQVVLDTTFLRQLYDAVTEIVIILNRHRQIVFYNRRLVECLGLSDPEVLYGLRPGEALNCRHASTGPDGCGTSEFCRTCGAVNAVLTSQAQDADVKECRILQADGGEALDLLVRATPLTLDGEPYTIFAATDISHEKRRRALERVFFHDLMNTATGLEIFARLLAKAKPRRVAELQGQIRQAVAILLEQIRSQHDLASAENRELAINRVKIASRTLLQSIIDLWQLGETTPARVVALDPDCADVSFTSDPVLLSRILNNMVKNAVEASADGGTVTVGCRDTGDDVEFWVHNVGCMPPDVRAQVFQRSFSTKGAGRGLGTYSMKLLGERYLRGQVSFASSETEGTIFRVRCPLAI